MYKFVVDKIVVMIELNILYNKFFPSTIVNDRIYSILFFVIHFYTI